MATSGAWRRGVEMAYCRECGASIDGAVKFCPECGTPAGEDAPTPPEEAGPPPTSQPTAGGATPTKRAVSRKTGCGCLTIAVVAVIIVVAALVGTSTKGGSTSKKSPAELRTSSSTPTPPGPTVKPSLKPKTPRAKIAAAVKAELTPPAKLEGVAFVPASQTADNLTGVVVLLWGNGVRADEAGARAYDLAAFQAEKGAFKSGVKYDYCGVEIDVGDEKDSLISMTTDLSYKRAAGVNWETATPATLRPLYHSYWNGIATP